MSKVKGLRDKAGNTETQAANLQRDYRMERDSAIQAATRNIDLFLKTKYTTPLRELETAHQAAVDALQTELERVALTGEAAPYPLGTILKKIVHKRTGDDPTTLYGRVEVFTRSSTSPGNIHDQWKLAKPGQFIVRHIKGTPDTALMGVPLKRYDTSFHDWKPIDSTIQRNEKFFAPKHIQL